MENAVRPASAAASTAPTQSATLEWRDDSVLVDVRPGSLQRFASRAGSLPYLNPSVLMMELLVKRAGQSSPPLDTVPVFLVSGGQTAGCTLRFASRDSLAVVLGPTSFGLRIDAQGHVLSGSVPAQGVRFERVDSLPDERLAVLPPDYSAPPGAPYTAEAVRVPTRGGFELAGTLTRPAGSARVPCVITITGSGPQDRDEKIALVHGYRPFRQLADTLSRCGLAVLRLDDRGIGESGGRFAGSTSADFSDDVDDAFHWLARQRGIDSTRIALLGHSEGGLIAPIVALREPRIAALVLMAGPAWDGRRILLYQSEWAVKKKVSGAALDSALVVAGRQIDSLAVSDQWYGFFVGYDPLGVPRKLARPHVLLMQGETDRQVTAGQANELAAAFRSSGNKDVTVHLLPATNHLFLPDTTGDPAGYAQLPSGEIPRATLGTIADWLASRLEAPHGTHTLKVGLPTHGSASPPPRR